MDQFVTISRDRIADARAALGRSDPRLVGIVGDASQAGQTCVPIRSTQQRINNNGWRRGLNPL